MPSPAGSNVPPVSTLPPASSSITVAGGMRPPAPTTTGAIAGPPPRSVTVGEVSSVVVRLVEPLPPGRNSLTVPLTVTAWPMMTLGADEVKTKTPSEVLSSPSGLGSCK